VYAPFAAQLSGQISGTSLTFAIAVEDTVHSKTLLLGPSTVVLGGVPNISVCPG
jgi:hypothetical protein